MKLNKQWLRFRISSFDAFTAYITKKLPPHPFTQAGAGFYPGWRWKAVDGQWCWSRRFEMYYYDAEDDKISLECEKDFQEAVCLMCGGGVEGGWGVDVPLVIFVDSTD